MIPPNAIQLVKDLHAAYVARSGYDITYNLAREEAKKVFGGRPRSQRPTASAEVPEEEAPLDAAEAAKARAALVLVERQLHEGYSPFRKYSIEHFTTSRK